MGQLLLHSPAPPMYVPRFAFLDVTTGWRLPTARARGCQAGHQLRCAYAIAALRREQVDAQAIELDRVTTLARLVGEVHRTDPSVVVLWAPEPAPPIVRAVARVLRASRDDAPLIVVAAGTTDGADVDGLIGDELESSCIAMATACAEGHDPRMAIALASRPAVLDELASPWLTDVLPARAAERVGIEIDRPEGSGSGPRRHSTERIVAELAWLDARAAPGSTVFLHGELPARDPGGAADLFESMAMSPLRRVGLGMTIAAEEQPDRALLTAFASAGGGRLRVALREHESEATVDRVRAWKSATAATHIRLEVVADLMSEQRDLGALESLLARVGAAVPTVRYQWLPAAPGLPPRRPLRLAVPELAGSSTFHAETMLEQSVLARFIRVHEGLYAPAITVDGAVIDLVWRHADPPTSHEGWLSQLLRADSLIVLTRGGSAAAVAPVSDVWPLHQEPHGRCRFETGDAIDVMPYRVGRLRRPEVPLVLTFNDADELMAMVADADEAHNTGRLPPAMMSELTHLEDAVLWTAPLQDPAGRLARMWVGAQGDVRTGPRARAIGVIGDRPDELLERALARAAPASCPAWLTVQDLVALHRQRPWLLPFAAVPAARRRLAEAIGPRPGRVVVRLPRSLEPVISGLGTLAACDGALGTGPRARHVLLRAGDAHLLYDPGAGGLAPLKPDVAAVWEMLACTHDPSATAAWLVDRLRVSARHAEKVATHAAARFASSIGPPLDHDIVPERLRSLP